MIICLLDCFVLYDIVAYKYPRIPVFENWEQPFVFCSNNLTWNTVCFVLCPLFCKAFLGISFCSHGKYGNRSNKWSHICSSQKYSEFLSLSLSPIYHKIYAKELLQFHHTFKIKHYQFYLCSSPYLTMYSVSSFLSAIAFPIFILPFTCFVYIWCWNSRIDSSIKR